MDLGFETIGNAVLICHDKGPVLVTDPWIEGAAYFGSWTFSHEIPEQQQENIRACRYVWISHGHPDHLSAESLELLRDKKILLPDHFGSRICDDLRQQGYDVTVLKDRAWTQLSDRIQILCIADFNQDAILLVDVGGKLLVNLNDASDCGWGNFVHKTIAKYKESFLLQLVSYGDADMINCFREDGSFIEPQAALAKRDLALGREVQNLTEMFGATHFIPFSSMHRYQRADSIWANDYATNLDDYKNGFDPDRTSLLPAFVSYDCARDQMSLIDPKEREVEPLPSEHFGDDWSETLEKDEAHKLETYFRSFEHIRGNYDFINFVVGGKEHRIEFKKKGLNRGITFEAPRGSLMKSVDWEIFDDMLIGNFMKTTIHGEIPARPLYPDFSPYVAKYGDNGRAHSEEELSRYFKAYRQRAPIDYFRRQVEVASINVFRNFVAPDSPFYKVARSVYRRGKKAGL